MKYKVFLDFDGTVVEHSYPKMGRVNFGCIEVIKKLQDAGHEIILNTYRADLKNGSLEEAIMLLNEDYWMCLEDRCKVMSGEMEFELNPITEVLENKIQPNYWDWKTHKASGIIYIDDICHGIPLKKAVMENNMMVDWDKVDLEFIENGVY